MIREATELTAPSNKPATVCRILLTVIFLILLRWNQNGLQMLKSQSHVESIHPQALKFKQHSSLDLNPKVWPRPAHFRKQIRLNSSHERIAKCCGVESIHPRVRPIIYHFSREKSTPNPDFPPFQILRCLSSNIAPL